MRQRGWGTIKSLMQYVTQLLTGRIGTFPYWLGLVALIAAEVLTVYLQLLAGIICHGILLVVFTIQAALAQDGAQRNLFMALCLAPLIRIISLSMPLVPIPQIYWYLLIYGPLLVSTVIVMFNAGLGPRDVGLVSKGWLLQAVLGILLGLGLGVLQYFILRPVPLPGSFTFEGVLAPVLVLALTTGLVEELIFRGVMQTLAGRVMGPWSVLYVSLIFAVLNTGHYSMLNVVFVFLAALLFASIVKRTGSLLGVTLAHGISNAVLYCVMPFILA